MKVKNKRFKIHVTVNKGSNKELKSEIKRIKLKSNNNFKKELLIE